MTTNSDSNFFVGLHCANKVLVALCRKVIERSGGHVELIKEGEKRIIPIVHIALESTVPFLSGGFHIHYSQNEAGKKFAHIFREAFNNLIPEVRTVTLQPFHPAKSLPVYRFMPVITVILGEDKPSDLMFINKFEEELANVLVTSITSFLNLYKDDLNAWFRKEVFFRQTIRKVLNIDIDDIDVADLGVVGCLGEVINEIEPKEDVFFMVPARRTRTPYDNTWKSDIAEVESSWLVATTSDLFFVVAFAESKSADEGSIYRVIDRWMSKDLCEVVYRPSKGNAELEIEGVNYTLASVDDLYRIVSVLRLKAPTGVIKRKSSIAKWLAGAIGLFLLILLISNFPSPEGPRTVTKAVMSVGFLELQDWVSKSAKYGLADVPGAIIEGWFYNGTNDYVKELEVVIYTVGGGQYTEWASCGNVAPHSEGIFVTAIVGSRPYSVKLTGRYKGLRKVTIEKSYGTKREANEGNK